MTNYLIVDVHGLPHYALKFVSIEEAQLFSKLHPSDDPNLFIEEIEESDYPELQHIIERGVSHEQIH